MLNSIALCDLSWMARSVNHFPYNNNKICWTLVAIMSPYLLLETMVACYELVSLWPGHIIFPDTLSLYFDSPFSFFLHSLKGSFLLRRVYSNTKQSLLQQSYSLQ